MGTPDVVVVGAGVIGAACAHGLTAAGLRVLVIDRGGPACGTTAAGEGNVLVSDKEPGPELELALASRQEWPLLLARVAERIGPGRGDVEWDPKGGLVVSTRDPAPLTALAATQRAAGVDARQLGIEDTRGLEPHLTERVTGAIYYPQDAQLHPVLAATALLDAVRTLGGEVRAGVTATGVRVRRGRVTHVATSAGSITCGAVLNACGPWAKRFAETTGTPVNVLPRKGIVLVTAPLPVFVRHKVCDADYVGAVASDDADVQTSMVIESTRAGTVLIGSSRERVGFDGTIGVRVLSDLARKAVAMFPVLAGVAVIRAYGGFRPFTADHLPIIGADPRLDGFWHATGHEGAGVGLAAATGRLIAELVTGVDPHVDPEPFRVDRPAILASLAGSR